MGNRKDNLDKGLELLSQRVQLGQVSSTYDTAPVGNTQQPRFLNLVCQVNTRLAPMGCSHWSRALNQSWAGHCVDVMPPAP